MLMRNMKFRYLLLFIILLLNSNVYAITFAERYHCDTLFHIGTAQQLQKWHDLALKDLLKLKNSKEDIHSKAHYYALLCECTLSQGHYKKSLEYAKQSEKMYQQLIRESGNDKNMSLSPDYALVCHYIGRLNYYLMTNLQHTIDYHAKCGQITADWGQRVIRTNDAEFIAKHRSNIMYTSIIMGIGEIMLDTSGHNFTSAVKAGDEVIDRIRENYPGSETRRFEYVDALILLSNVYFKSQDYEQALHYIQEAMTSVENTWGCNNTTYARTLYTAAAIYFQLNNRNSCEKYLFRCIDIYEKTGHITHAEYADALELLGRLYQSLAIITPARDYYEKALNVIITSCGNDCFHVLLNRYYTTSLLMNEDRHQEVFQQMEKLLGNMTFVKNLSSDHVVSALTLYYESSLLCGRYREVIDKVDDTEEVLKLIGEIGQSEANNIYISIGRIYQTLQRHTDACNSFQKALRCLRVMARRNFSFLPEEQRSAFWDHDNLNFENILLQNQYTKDDLNSSIGKLLFNAALLQKGLLLNTSVNMAKIVEDKGPVSLKRDLHRLQLMMQSKLKTQEEKQACARLEQYVQQEARKYGDFMSFAEYTWQDVQKVMKARDVAIEFVSSDDDKQVYASAEVLTCNQKSPKHIFLFSYRKSDELTDRQISAKYVEAIRQKIIPLLKPGDYVYFAPVAQLYQLPIEYIELANKKRMDEVYHMFRVSSTRELIGMRNQRIPQKKMALFGGLNYNTSLDDMELQAMLAKDKVGSTNRGNRSYIWQYLAGTMKEVQEISSIMRNSGYKVSLFTQEEGVEEHFKALSETHTGIIHIATHGFYEADQSSNAENAGLIFAGANNFWNSSFAKQQDLDNGILTVSEIANLNLIGTDLVVLSACQTGLGKVTSEGVFGLQRAFKKAGVQSILMSLWEVDDEATHVLMTAFYKYLKAGDSKRDALRKAQAQVRQNSFLHDGKMVSGEDIYFWGGFIMID